MKIKFTLSVILVFFLCQSQLSAQVEKVIYQYLTVNDSTSTVHLRINDTYEVIPWHHENQIMIETTANLQFGSMDLLRLVIQDGRYKLDLEKDVPTVNTLKFQNEARPFLKNRNVICKETVKLKIYIPDVFVKKSETDYARPVETMIAAKG